MFWSMWHEAILDWKRACLDRIEARAHGLICCEWVTAISRVPVHTGRLSPARRRPVAVFGAAGAGAQIRSHAEHTGDSRMGASKHCPRLAHFSIKLPPDQVCNGESR
jgi:hypothetical protein